MKKEKLTYLIHGLIIFADFLIIFIFSILTINFTEEKNFKSYILDQYNNYTNNCYGCLFFYDKNWQNTRKQK